MLNSILLSIFSHFNTIFSNNKYKIYTNSSMHTPFLFTVNFKIVMLYRTFQFSKYVFLRTNNLMFSCLIIRMCMWCPLRHTLQQYSTVKDEWAFNNASERSTVGHSAAGNVMSIDEFHRIILQRNIRYWHDLICSFQWIVVTD